MSLVFKPLRVLIPCAGGQTSVYVHNRSDVRLVIRGYSAYKAWVMLPSNTFFVEPQSGIDLPINGTCGPEVTTAIRFVFGAAATNATVPNHAFRKITPLGEVQLAIEFQR